MAAKNLSELTAKIKSLVDCRELFREEFPEHYHPTGNSLCPWHEDTTPSLEVKRDVALCFGGCSTNGKPRPHDAFDILRKSQNLSFVQARHSLAERCGLNIEKPTPRNTKPEAVYPYCNEKGELLFEVCRFEGKEFRQRRPDGKGGYTWSLGDTRRVLFGLPQLLKAAPDEPVLIVEGERDVLTAQSLGFTATCNPGGAGKWRSLCERWKIHEPLRNRVVWIIPDNDEPGRKHAEDVARSLTGFAKSVKILTLPGLSDKQDLSDFVELHGPDETRVRISELPNSIPEYIPTPTPDREPNADEDAPTGKFQKCRQTFLATGSAVFLDQHNTGWATVKFGESYQNIRLSSSAFTRYVLKLFVDAHGQGVSGEIIGQVADYLEASAVDTRPLSNRFAWQGNHLLIDMGTPDWSTLEITRDGYSINRPRSPVFKRHAHQQPLPNPEPGGAVADILAFLPIKNPDDQILVQVWLVTAALEQIPRPPMNTHGAHGAGKTHAAIFLRSLLDPSSAPALSLSRDHTEFVQLLDHHAVPVFDNVHRLPQSLSDDLSRAVTGTGFSKRRLYTDDDDHIYQFRRTAILNGINAPATSPDLLDRSITIRFERIPDDERREERELAAAFAHARPRIFGAMVQALSAAMRIADTICLERSPRMADWTRWGCAVAEALGIGQQKFLAAYYRNIGAQNDEIMGSEPVCVALTEFMAERELWTGKPGELYAELLKIAEDQSLTNEKTWPRAANAFSRRLNELQHNLREAGFEISRGTAGRGKNLRATVVVTKTRTVPKISPTSPDRHQTAPGAVPSDDDMLPILSPDTNIPNISPQKNLPESQDVGDVAGVGDTSRTVGGQGGLDPDECKSCEHKQANWCGKVTQLIREMQECPLADEY